MAVLAQWLFWIRVYFAMVWEFTSMLVADWHLSFAWSHTHTAELLLEAVCYCLELVVHLKDCNG